MDLTSALQVAGVVATVIGGVMALFTYARDVEHKRTDWLYRLFESFYEKDTYKRVRAVLDGPGAARLRNIIASPGDPTSQEDEALLDTFCDYLNFFEFMCNLVEKGRMARDDLNRLFDYYLNNLARLGVRKYALENGYEALARELNRRK